MELKEIRAHLDRIDNAIVVLLAERLSLIPEVAKYKKENDIPRYQPDREKEIITKKRVLAEQNNVSPDFIEKIFKEIIEEAHKIEKKVLGE